ncbi:IS3 family transposase [Lentzea flava]
MSAARRPSSGGTRTSPALGQSASHVRTCQAPWPCRVFGWAIDSPTLPWTTRDEARSDVFAYLRYYNHDRLHSTIGHRIPAETRAAHAA